MGNAELAKCSVDMRRALAWALAATTGLTAASLWFDKSPRLIAAMDSRMTDTPQVFDEARSAPPSTTKTSAPLPNELPPLLVEAAKRDFFVPYAPPPPPAAAPPPPPPVVSVVAVQAAVPQAPAITLRFLGSMVTPAGDRLVYLARGDAVVPVLVGDRLDEGYVVTALASDAVTLTYPPLETRVVVPISQPASP